MKFIPRSYQDYIIKGVINLYIAGIFLDMGLGKTVSMLTALELLIYDYFRVGRVLVIAPKKVAEATWPDEIKKWEHLSRLTFSVAVGKPKDRIEAIKANTDICIINRENVPWLIELFGEYKDKRKKTGFHLTRRWPFDTVVIDELKGFKDPGGKWFKLFTNIRPFTSRLYLLSGTPTPNGLIQIWGPLYLLDAGYRLCTSLTQFKDTFFLPSGYIKNQNGNLIPTKYELRQGAEEEIYKRIGDICVSMKSEDHLNLPDRINNFITVKLDPVSRKVYKELEKEFCLQFSNTEVVNAGSAAALHGKLHQLAQGAVYLSDLPGLAPNKNKDYKVIHNVKLQALEDIVADAMGQPVLIGYWFKHDLDRLKSRFKKARVLKKPKDIEDWNAGKIEILLAHPESAGHGLNLQFGGRITIWFALTFDYELYSQFIKRLHRPGQKETCIVNHIVAEDTVDEDILLSLEHKHDSQDRLMEATKARIRRYTK